MEAAVRSSSKLSEVDGMGSVADGASISVTADGKTSTIDLSSDMTISQFVVKLKNAGLTASFDENNQRFFISSKSSGADNDFSMTAANSNGKNALGALKLQATTADTVAKDIAKYQTIAGTDKNTYIADTAKSNYDATIEQYNTAIEKLKTSNAELEEKNKKLAYQKQYVDSIRKNMLVFGLGPAGTGKSQIAYAVARILKLPWTTLDMSSINDPEQLTGSSRIYANAKPGIIMEAFSMAGESNLVFIINELDKAASGKGNGNPADVLLTLLDNLGFTDNYMECTVPTFGVYPIATANDKEQISAPLMSRFAVIDIPDYTPEEKKIIFSKFALPKVLKRIGLQANECTITEEGLEAVVEIYSNTSGIRDLEQAAEHLAANALYQIEVDGLTEVVFDAEKVKKLFL